MYTFVCVCVCVCVCACVCVHVTMCTFVNYVSVYTCVFVFCYVLRICRMHVRDVYCLILSCVLYTHTVILQLPLQMSVPAVPVFICASGLCDVQYTITVACRDAFVYTYKK